MSHQSRHDAWQAGRSYDRFMGRWSRELAPRFLDWLDPASGLDWLEVGCGTGALSAVIMAQGRPARFVGIEPSESFLAQARANAAEGNVRFLVGDARALPVEDASADMAVSGLVLNFVADRAAALAEMKRTARRGGTIAFYVWDYPNGGMEFIHAFWAAAASLDPKARDLAEDRRFAFCTREGLTGLAEAAGLHAVGSAAIEIPTPFTDFEDFWHPFTLGAGPAPGYCQTLDDDARQRLKETLRRSLPFGRDGSIAMKARAWAVRGTVG